MNKNVKKSALKPLYFFYNVMLGCDPEFFFTTNGQVVGSEKVLPKEGITMESEYGYDDTIDSKFIIDGVQAEINPAPGTCRAFLGNEIHCCFRRLWKELKEKGQTEMGVDFSPLVNISQSELDSLSEKSKVFGCAPSKNINFGKKKAKIKVNPKKYLKRSAGGHVHLGDATDGDEDQNYWYDDKEDKEHYFRRTIRGTLRNPAVLVPILDLVVANTCVLLDRDESNVERRKNYGRVGEYRLKEYGIEYRTLSNFWLRSYQLMSFVMGLSRMAVHLVHQSRKGNDYLAALMAAVPRKDVIKAVQNNDFKLAYRNFKKIEPILLAAGASNNYDYPITRNTIKEFHHVVKRGIDYWFDHDVLQHWVKLPDGHGHGWESFCHGRVRKDMKGLTKKSAKGVTVDLNGPQYRCVRRVREVAAEIEA